MPEPVAYLNGQLVAAARVSIPLDDAGFVLGATVTERLRTFGGKLFRVDEHLARLFRSLRIVDVDPGLSESEFSGVCRDLATRNHALLDQGDDLGLAILVSPGPYASFARSGAGEPLVCIYTYPVPFEFWAERYEQGEALVIPRVRQVSPRAWPRALKCRSRMHYFLADRQAEKDDPGARALLVDEDGAVTETTTASLLIHQAGRGLISPPGEKILPGISVAVVAELARSLDIPFGERDLRPEDVAAADEVMLASTSSCLLPVVRLDRKPIGSGRPGAVYRRLLSAWSRMVGVDIAAQAARFARRPPV